MSVEADITTAITESTAIQAVIGGRMYWDIADATAAPPYLVAQLISEDGDTPHDGIRETAFATIQFACWAKTAAAATNLAAIFRSEFEGNVIDGDTGCVMTFSNRTSNYDPASRLFGCIIDMRASYSPN